MARKKAPAVDFRVSWNPTRSTYDIARNGESTGAFAKSKATAIGNASALARQEMATYGVDVIVTSITDGKIKREWPIPD